MTMPNDTMTNDRDASVPPDTTDTGGQTGTASPRAQIRDMKDQVVDQAKQSFRQARWSSCAHRFHERGRWCSCRPSKSS